jgi:predicted alpha-1,2-mannosidase
MKKGINVIGLVIVLVFSALSSYSQLSLTKHVDPYIGTENGGNVFPGVTVPFGMVKLGPDCGNNDNNSGYYRNQDINGFSHTHVSGTGGGAKYGNILVVPQCGDLLISQYSSPRTNEVSMPGYYSALLSRYDIKAELTATHSVGFHRYTFADDQLKTILIDVGHFLEFGKDWGESQEFVGSEIKILSDHEIEGYSRIRGGWNKGGAYTVYFYAVFDQPAIESGTWKNGKIEAATLEQPDTGEKAGAFLTFGKSSAKTIQVKVGISYISVGKAKLNVGNEIPGWDFNEVRVQAEKKWNSELEKVQVEGGTDDQKKMLYTALYHSMLMPTNRTGENPLWKSSEPYYDDYYAIWDTYRTTHPLLTLISPNIQRDIIRSMIDIYRYDGYMPDARSGNINGRTQGGSNSDIIIADAFVKGLGGIDYETALKAMIKNAEVPPGENEQKEGRGGIPDYNSSGYVSTSYERAGTRTMEYAACDHAIATVAKGLGHNDLYEKYLNRSSNWKNLWRSVESYGAKGFIWPRLKDGSWDENFNALTGGSWNDFFYESQSWEISLYVPHDVAGLVAMCGGPAAFESRLDTFFIKSKPRPDSWLIDFYNVNNEPGFLTPILYNYIGKPAKSNDQVRQIITRYFGTGRDGLPGNDDSGAMSEFLAFHLMGFYPVAGQDLYQISASWFNKVIISLGNGKQFTIVAKNLNSKNKYVQTARLNGQDLDRTWYRHTEIQNGGTLELEMGIQPSRWRLTNFSATQSK